MVHESHDEAIRRGLDGFRFFGYAIATCCLLMASIDQPLESVEALRPQSGDDMRRGCASALARSASPASVREHLEELMSTRQGVDQMIFIQQSGANQHDHICEAMELFAREVMPALKEGEDERLRCKDEESWPLH